MATAYVNIPKTHMNYLKKLGGGKLSVGISLLIYEKLGTPPPIINSPKQDGLEAFEKLADDLRYSPDRYSLVQLSQLARYAKRRIAARAEGGANLESTQEIDELVVSTYEYAKENNPAKLHKGRCNKRGIYPSMTDEEKRIALNAYQRTRYARSKALFEREKRLATKRTPSK